MSIAANKVLCLPYSAILGDNAANRARILKTAEAIAASPEQPEVIVLPELALSGYLLESLAGEVAVSRCSAAANRATRVRRWVMSSLRQGSGFVQLGARPAPLAHQLGGHGTQRHTDGQRRGAQFVATAL